MSDSQSGIGAGGFVSTMTRNPDGSLTFTWPRNPTVKDETTDQVIPFRPRMEGPVVNVLAHREPVADVSNALGVTMLAYTIPASEVVRATNAVDALLARGKDEFPAQ
ncbi:MAG: hypothetical protein WAW91_02930 [Candidatus Nanoperiomorbaceae bacterium]